MLAGMMLWGATMFAQTTPGTDQPASQTPGQAPSAQPGQTAPYPGQPGQAAPGATQPGQPSPEAQAQPSDPNGVQTFTGTVVQQSGKYVLQSDNGTTYDIDHQDQVKKFEGKRVRVHGTLDGKMIHVQ